MRLRITLAAALAAATVACDEVAIPTVADRAPSVSAALLGSRDTWASVPSPTSARLDGIWARNPKDVWAVDIEAGGIHHFDGAVWASLPSPTSQGLAAIWGLGSRDVWAFGTDILRFDGRSWANRGAAPFPVLGAWGASLHDFWIVGGSPGGAAQFDGDDWQAASLPDTRALFGVWGAGPRNIWAVGDSGTAGDPGGAIHRAAVLHYDGRSWASVAPPAGAQGLRAVGGSSGEDVWAVGVSGTILHYDGTEWTAAASPTTSHLESVWARGPRDAWAVGSQGVILHFNGQEWAAVASPTGASLQDVWGVGPDVWAVGFGGAIAHTR